MDQDTTIIHARELFGDFKEIGSFRNHRSGFETTLWWPQEFGNGFMHLIKFRPGLVLGTGRFRLSEKIAVCFDLKSSPITLGFSLSGDIHQAIDYREGQRNIWHFKRGHSVMTYLPECHGVTEYPVETDIDCVVVCISPQLLHTFLNGQHDRISTDLLDIVHAPNDKLFHQTSDMTPAINAILHQIRNPPGDTLSKKLYLEGKTMELVSQSMARLFPRKIACSGPSLHLAEIERIRRARDILVSDLEHPPSLFELASRVGINKNKLNQGFHHLFGTSVFDYLRICRLERARTLLENTQMNVTEVAFEVGYAQHSNFTKAFKKYFGVAPSRMLT